MTLYLDTSSLVKLYVEEIGSDDVRELVAEAVVVSTSIVAYPETRAALARLRRRGDLSLQHSQQQNAVSSGSGQRSSRSMSQNRWAVKPGSLPSGTRSAASTRCIWHRLPKSLARQGPPRRVSRASMIG